MSTITIRIRTYYGDLYHTETITRSADSKYFRFIKNASDRNFKFATYDKNKNIIFISEHTYTYSGLMGVADTSGLVFMGMSYGLNSRFADAMPNSTDSNGVPNMEYQYTDFGYLNVDDGDSIDIFGSLQPRSNFSNSTGGMVVYFGNNKTGSNYLTKSVDWSKSYNMIFVNGEFDLEKPTFKVYIGSDKFTYNYCKIPKFNDRYYYIISRKFSDGYVMVSCKTDVLYTYNNLIKNTYIQCERLEKGYDTNIYDPSIPVEVNPRCDIFYGSKYSKTFADKNHNTSADTILCVMSAKKLTHPTQYGYKVQGDANLPFVLNSEQYRTLIDYIQYQPTDTQNCIKYAIAYPFDIKPFLISYKRTEAVTLKWGPTNNDTWVTPINTAYEIGGIYNSIEYMTFDRNKLNSIFGEKNEWTKSDRYASYQLFLPFASPITLRANDFKDADALRIDVTLDVFSGSIKYFVRRIVSGSTSVAVATATGMVGIKQTLTPSNWANVQVANANAMTNAVVGTVVGVAGSAVAGNYVGAGLAAVGGVASIATTANSFSVNTGNSQTISASGSTSNVGDDRVAFIKRIWQKPFVPAQYNYTRGRLSTATKLCSTLSGMVWGRPMLSTVGNGMTDAERSEIISLFAQGIYC